MYKEKCFVLTIRQTQTMREFNFIEFHNNLQKNFLDANRIISDIENAEWADMHTPPDEREYDQERDFNKVRLVDIIETIKLKIDFAHEFLALPKMAEKLTSELVKRKSKFGELEFISYVDVFYSPVLQILTKHLNALTSHIKIETESEYENTNSLMLLEQILRGTPKMLSDRNIEPTNEALVRSEVYKNLIHVFPDTVREIPIAKVSKAYKPDIGIKRLKCAVEYKFVNSENEAKVAIGGIYEDINGYEGSEDWTTFYAVIYMTDNFMTQDQVEAEFRLSKVPHHWKPIVVFGKGQRVKPTQKKRRKNNV
jgi:hypothetical protein